MEAEHPWTGTITFCLQSPFPGDKEEPSCNSTSCFVVIVFKFINLPLLVLKGCSLKYFSWLPAKVCWKLKLELEENLEAREASGASNTHFPFSHRLWRHFTVFVLSQQAGSPVLADRLKEQSPSAFAIKCQGDFLTFLCGNSSQLEIKVTEDSKMKINIKSSLSQRQNILKKPGHLQASTYRWKGWGESFDQDQTQSCDSLPGEHQPLFPPPPPTLFSWTEMEMEARALHILGKYCVVEQLPKPQV